MHWPSSCWGKRRCSGWSILRARDAQGGGVDEGDLAGLLFCGIDALAVFGDGGFEFTGGLAGGGGGGGELGQGLGVVGESEEGAGVAFAQ